MQTTVTASDGRLIGYARVSTVDQSLDLQMDEVKSAGCCEILAVLSWAERTSN